jgi:hypothetical protein
MKKRITYKQIIPISLFVIVGCAGIDWLTIGAIAIRSVAAQTAEVNIAIARQNEETYEDFLRRAEATASKTIHSRFKQEPAVSELRVAIVGENEGAIAPVLSLKVSRNSWRTSPNIQQWATYYPDSKFLLGFEQPIAQPQPETAPQSEQQPSPQQQPIPTQEPIPAEEPQSAPESPLRRLTPGQQAQPSE